MTNLSTIDPAPESFHPLLRGSLAPTDGEVQW